MWTVTLLTTLAFTGMVFSYIGGPATLQMTTKPHFYCGRELAGVLSALCFDQEGYEKRGEGRYNSIVPPYYRDIQELDWPWLNPHKARALATHGKNKRYVVNECCEKACSLAELMTYC